MSKTIKTFIMTMVCLLMFITSAQAASQYSGVVNINTASLEQIMLLPGIGAKKAQAIVELRSKKAFSKIEELLLVDGIGEVLFAKIKPYLSLEGQTTLKQTQVSAAPTTPAS